MTHIGAIMGNFKNSFLALLILSVFNTFSESVAQDKEIVLAVSPMASPVSNLSMYNDFISYLTKKTGHSVIMKQRRKCSEINSLLETGQAQFAFTCTGTFLNGRREFGFKALAVPVIKEMPSHHSYIIVNRKSQVKEFLKLQGKVFAFTDPLSLTGRLYPLHLLNSMGVKPEEFFRKAFYTSSHEKSIVSVAKGFADGAAVDSIVYDRMKKRGHLSVDKVEIIATSPPYGIPPVVVSPHAGEPITQFMSKILMNMSTDSAGIDVLHGLQIEKFIPPDPSMYHAWIKQKKAASLP
jgi:phosphonate transport system substrate-binding protein